MDRLRCLTKSKTSTTNDPGDQQVRQEKSKSKLSSSSSVAKLTRFDGHNLPRISPVALQGDAHFLDSESHRKRFTEEPESKDIFEDKFRNSGSSRDAILELLKNPNPLFLKHLQGVRESSSSSLCCHLPILKQSHLQKYQAEDLNTERNTSRKHNIGSKQTHGKGILNRSSTLASTQNQPKPSKIHGEEKEGTNKGTSRIVLLKPNHAMARDARSSSSSHDPSRANISGSRKSKGHMGDWTKDEDFVETIDFVDGVEVLASRVREAKKIAKKVVRELRETTRTMKETESKEAAKRFNGEVQEVSGRMRIDFPSHVKGIHGRGGLHYGLGIDSASKSEVMKITSYDSTESYISRQARKRLLDRWRNARRYEQARICGKGSTLGEMLCIQEEKLKNLDAADARRDRPLGISNTDGWKDEYSNIKPRPRSLPPPGTRNEKLNAEREYRTDDKLLISKEARYQSQSDRLHGSFTERKDDLSKTSSSSKRRSKSRHRRISNSYALLGNHICHDNIDHVKKDSPEENPMVPLTPTVSSTIGTEASTTLEYYTALCSSVSPDVCCPNVSKNMLIRCDFSCGGEEHSNPEHLGAEAESSGSLKEADPSPISVPEVASRKDVSSGPECSKQVSADLHDLRKQLSLRSRESMSNFNAPMHFKTDFAGEGSSLALHANEIVVFDCWESLYIDDVLIECGLYDLDTDVFMPGSKGPNNHPIGPRVFYNLEKKYYNEMCALKYERMLVFDRIRSVVLEISQSCMDQCPWVKPAVRAEYGLKWAKSEVHKLLAIQDAEIKEGMWGKVIDKDTYCGDVRNSVDVIGIKIERSLTNDLVMELVKELQFDVQSYRFTFDITNNRDI